MCACAFKRMLWEKVTRCMIEQNVFNTKIYHSFDPSFRNGSKRKKERKKKKIISQEKIGLDKCNEAKPQGGIYTIRLLTKRMSFFLSFFYFLIICIYR